MNKKIFDRLGIDLNTLSKEGKGFFRGFIKEYNRNIDKFNNPVTQKYFHMLITAMMLEHHKSNGNYNISALYRIKSPKSVLDKVLDYLSRSDKSEYELNQFGEPQGKLKEDLSDMFAMTLIMHEIPLIGFDKDPEIYKLIKERDKNYNLKCEMDEYKSRLTDSESSSENKVSYKLGEESLTREEYYVYSMVLIDRIKTLVHPSATKLLKRYDDMLDKIKENLPEEFITLSEPFVFEANTLYPRTVFDKKQIISQITSSHIQKGLGDTDKLREMKRCITEQDINVVNCLELMDDFEARMQDKLYLGLLRKQIIKVFEESELLKQFSVKLIPESLKQKRTESGYVADFIYLETPFGKIEVQLQSKHENKEGRYGYAAHCDMDGKSFKEFDIPDMGDEQQLKDFRTCVEFVSAKKFSAELDNSEKNRIVIHKSGKYENYKSIMTQVKEGSDEDIRLKQYFSILYNSRDEIFPDEAEQDGTDYFIDFDIEEYLKSKEFQEITGRKSEELEDR